MHKVVALHICNGVGGSVRRWPELAQSCEERRHRRQRRCHAGESGTCPQDVEEKCMVDELPSLRYYQPELLLEHIRIMPGGAAYFYLQQSRYQVKFESDRA